LPFILRRQENDEYRLVGESCVHGLIDSEAIQGTGEKDFQNFVLVWSAKGHRVCRPRPRPQQEDSYRGASKLGFVKERGLEGATQARNLCLDVFTTTQITISDRTRPRRPIGGLEHGSRSATGQRVLEA
jgi:hypothetical protein